MPTFSKNSAIPMLAKSVGINTEVSQRVRVGIKLMVDMSYIDEMQGVRATKRSLGVQQPSEQGAGGRKTPISMAQKQLANLKT